MSSNLIEGLKVYGPRQNSRGYWIVRLYDGTKVTTMSYAKYLLIQAGIDMEGKQAHHIDGNLNNNTLANLAALPIEEHRNLHKKQPTFVDIVCVVCNKNAKKALKDFNLAKKLGRQLTCGRGCSARLGVIARLS